MANADIISQILEHCRRHEAGDITATQLEREIDAHSEALEGISTADISRFRAFSARLVAAYFDDTTADVLSEFRSWLRELAHEPNDIPKALLSRSLSDRLIVLPYPDVITTIGRLSESRLRVLGWEGWLRYPDGRIGHSARQQGTVDLSNIPPHQAAEICIRTIEQAHAEATREPEPGELYFCLTVNPT